MSLLHKIRSIIKLAVITNASSDIGAIPINEISYRGKVANSAPWFPFGFHAVPENGTLTLVVNPNARDEERIDFATSVQRRIPVSIGEVVVYHPATKSKIHFRADGSIDIDSPTQVNVTAPLTQVTGDLDVTGNVDVGGTIDVEGDATFEARILVDPLNNPTGTDIDLVDHEHPYKNGLENQFTDGPKDP
tara:strand:- start:6705 stop:7274 length:570 start_codon:yes stop_codon:yes gene_type:complete